MTVDLLESFVSDTLNTLEFSSAIDQQLGAGQDGLSLSTLLCLYRDLAQLGLVFIYHWVKPRSHDMKQSLSHDIKPRLYIIYLHGMCSAV